ncbi:hypothetical protein DSCW_66320 [Desulfosarcina widdelii]|uniref:Uncharacterized protein n=1 Tax=Desulfosarcina widdelii TaxID=947919 RepID=A0A5K7ZEH3_9BACT|nr:hypothetical protein [Desulfosarcina widdelii]BBO79215.1 hypothetical protein DSCW_66320 [Desulfosarcina widdelii]
MSQPSEQRRRRKTEFSPEEIRDADAADFYSTIAFQNFSRMRMMAMVALVIFLPLFIWDLIRFFHGYWQQSIGYPIIAFSHLGLLFLLAGILLLARWKMPQRPSSIQRSHKRLINGVLATALLSTLPLALGDVLAGSAIDVYIGMVFAYASIFVLPNRIRLVLFGTYMASMVILLIGVYFAIGQSMAIHLINVVAFAIVAFILSRVLFLYNRQDFFNRRLIDRQSEEIKQQNEKNEALIAELRSALEEVKTLSGFIPICSVCKKIRDDKGYWNQIEEYISTHSDARFSHGICPACMQKMYPEQYASIQSKASDPDLDEGRQGEPE